MFRPFPSPSGQKNSCGVNTHENRALRQRPAASCIRPPGPRGGVGDGTRPISVLLHSKKAPSGAPTGFRPPHPCFSADALYTAQPPARSNDERGAYFWIGVSNMLYLLLSWDTVRMLGKQGNSGVCQSIKHRYTQTSALVATKTRFSCGSSS